MYKYSPSKKCFFLEKIHGAAAIPTDAVDVSEAEYVDLMAAQGNGYEIRADADGRPHAAEREKIFFVSTRCTPAQGLVALFAIKRITEEDVLSEIARIPDEVERYTARIGYQRATTWERNSKTMQTMAQLLHLSGSDLDELFTYATGVAV